MRLNRMCFTALLVLLSLPRLHAQEKVAQDKQAQDKPAGESTGSVSPQIPLKVQFVISEYDGAKKIASMPYSLSITTGSHFRIHDTTEHLRVGARIAVPTGNFSRTSGGAPSPAAMTQFQYVDIGTSIDLSAWAWGDNRYLVSGTIDVSSLSPKDSTVESAALADPAIHQFRGDFEISLHDGQPGEPISVTNPITGHVFKVEITASAAK